MLRTNHEEYDIIVSLGGSCSAAAQLKHRGKRPYSLPLDWALMTDDRPIRAIPDLFVTKFHNFCTHENMSEFEQAGDEYGTKKYHLEDSLTGYRLIHHFTALPTDEAAYNAQRDILMRRVDRLYKKMQSAKRALFVLNTAFPYDPTLLLPVLTTLNKVFANTDIEIVAMQFSSTENKVLELQNGKIKINLIARPLDIVYDNQLTAPEWCWMDVIRISGVPLPEKARKKLFIKWAYKIWHTLGKYLESHGAGCANMRFYRFKHYQ